MPTTIDSYQQLKDHLNGVLQRNQQASDTASAPHGAFWNSMTHAEFIAGKVPHVTDSGKAMPILVVGDSSHSNLVLALQGAAGTPFDPATGVFGQMPADGPPFFTPEEIEPIASWIDRGCPA